MARKRRRTRASAAPGRPVAHARPAVRFATSDEVFFAAGHAGTTEEVASVETFEDLDEGARRPSFWQRLFARAR